MTTAYLNNSTPVHPDTGSRYSFAILGDNADLAGETQATFAVYFRFHATSTNDVSIFGSMYADASGIYGNRSFRIYADAAGVLTVLGDTTNQPVWTSTTGVCMPDVEHHLVVVFDHGETQEIEVYLDGTQITPDTYTATVNAAFLGYSGQEHWILGWEANSPASDNELWVDYCAVWLGAAADLADVGTMYPYRDLVTALGAPDHLWDFESNRTDTGSSPVTPGFTLVHDVTYSALYSQESLVPAVCSSLPWAQSIEAEDASFVVWTTIEGCGDSDGLFRFSTSTPHFEASDGTWRPWLAEWPNLLSEGSPREEGGIVDAGEVSLSIVDIDDTLTSEWRTERDPTTVLAENVARGDTAFDVLDASGLEVGQIIYIASEAMLVEDITSNTLTVFRARLDTTAVAIEAGTAVYQSLPYLLSRRIRVYVANAEACTDDDAQAIGVYRVDQKALDDGLGIYTIRGPSQIIFANAQVSRRQPDRYAVKTAFPSGKIVCQAQPRFQRYSPVPYWDLPGLDSRCFLKVGGEIAIAENVSGSIDQYPIFELRERGVLGTTSEDVTSAESVEVVFGADPRTFATGAKPTFFRYSPGPTPSTTRASGTWIASCNWVDLILNLLVSSATAEDGLELGNRVDAHGAWDCLPPGVGIGQRAASIDWASALSVRARTPDYLFANFVVPNEPVTFGELVTEEFLRPIGAYLTTSGGRLRIVMPRIPLVGDTSFEVGHADIVSERVGQRLYGMGLRVSQDMSEVVTSLEYELGRGGDTLTINDSDYDLTYGSKGYREHETRRRKVKVPSVRPDTDGSVEFLKNRGMSVMARKRYPATTISYTTSGLKYWEATTGDVLELTHGQVPDQSAGVRGVVGMQGELRQRTVKVEPDSVQIEHTLRVDVANSRMGLIAPCARIVSVATDGSNRAITVSANRFTDPEAGEPGLPATDAAAFSVGDEVVLRERDGTEIDPTTQTVTAIAGNVITVDGNFSGSLDLGTTDAGQIIAYADHDSSVAQQTEAYVYTADDTTRTIDGSADKPWRFAEV